MDKLYLLKTIPAKLVFHQNQLQNRTITSDITIVSEQSEALDCSLVDYPAELNRRQNI